MRISDWSSDVCSSDLGLVEPVDEDGLARPRIGGHQPLSRAAPEPGDGQPGQRFGEIGDVGLRISRAHAERVQFHDLARQIFVEPRRLPPATIAHARREPAVGRSEEHTSELQSLMRISYAVFCLKKKKKIEK